MKPDDPTPLQQRRIDDLKADPNQESPSEGATLSAEQATVYYGRFTAIRDVSLAIPARKVTAFIGPSGCGKSTLLRCFNRLNDLIDGFRLAGTLRYSGQDLYASDVDPVEVRRRIGIVFQQPNPFPKSIYNNVAYGARVTGRRGDLDELVETSLRRAALWEEVKDKLNSSGLSLSGGQQQRLCIARAIATEPDVVLMDEPCSALDPVSTQRIEALIGTLAEAYTIVIVTHNMQQAARVADMTAFFNVQASGAGGHLVEYGPTEGLFKQPQEEATWRYINGQFG